MPARAAGGDDPPRRARRSRLSALVATIALATTLAGGLWLGASELLDHRERNDEWARAARAAAADRQSREDQLRVWTEVLRGDAASALALGHLAALNVQKGRETGQESHYPVAEEMARRSLRLRTQRNGAAYVTLASALLAQHRFAEAREAAAAARALDPDVFQYDALLAELDMELGNYEAASQGFARVAPYRSHLSVGPRLARWAEVTGRPGAAREILEELVAEASDRDDLPREQLAWFHLRLGDHYLRHGSLRRAHRSLTRALETNPGDYRAHNTLAKLALAKGAPKAALRHARAATAGSRTPETLLTLAGALHASGAEPPAHAIEAEVAAEIGADGGTFERAWHEYRLERGMAPRDLAALLEREAAARPDVEGYHLLAWAYYQENRIVEARAAILIALRTGTSDAAVWHRAGAIFKAAGDSARAAGFRLRARALNPALRGGSGSGLAVRKLDM